MSQFAIVPYWRVLQQQQQTDSAFRYPGSGWMEELFGGCCLRFEKGGQRRGHSPCGPKTLWVHPTPTCPRCRPAAGALSRGGLVGSSGEDSCFGAGAGWGRQPCLRPTVHPGRGRVRRDGTKWTPLSNLQQATVNRTRGGGDSSPYYFPRNTCAVSVAEESTTACPGQDNEARMGTGHVRPSRPRPSLPSLRCPAAGSHLLRNASRVSRDCETPMRIDPQGPHSSTARPLSTRSIPT